MAQKLSSLLAGLFHRLIVNFPAHCRSWAIQLLKLFRKKPTKKVVVFLSQRPLLYQYFFNFQQCCQFIYSFKIDVSYSSDMCWLTGRGPDCRGGVPGFESSKSVTVYKTLKTSRLTVCMLKNLSERWEPQQWAIQKIFFF